MDEDFYITGRVNSTDYTCDVGAEVWVDDICIHDSAHVSQPIDFSYKMSNDEDTHELRIIMKDKKAAHSKFNSDGTLLSTVSLKISDITMAEISLENILSRAATYTHNFNGSGETVIESFYSLMGCNGTVSLKFVTPLYLFLIEYPER